MEKLITNISETAEMIQFKHTVFALPFALMSMITASGVSWPEARIWWWVVVAMVGARTAAMAFNRLVDHKIDALNPRTEARSLPAGRLSRLFVVIVIIVASGLFVIAAAQLNHLCLVLAGPTLAVLLGYSYAKRFTAFAHLWLGAALGIAPIGAWIAVTGSLEWPPLVLGAAVAMWVAGFDTIYSLQDEVFDRDHGLRSIPARYGASGALRIARSFHFAASCGFAAFAVAAGGGWLRALAVLIAAALIVKQHTMISPENLNRVDAAFFSINGILAILMLCLFTFAKILSGS